MCQPESKKYVWHAMLVGILLSVTAACGAAGSPIAPEDVGLEAKIRKQRQEQQLPPGPNNNGEYLIPLEEEPLQLPPLHPVGVR